MKRIRLGQRRKAVGLTQERLAEILGVDRSTVVRWERAETDPQPWLRPKLARALRVSVDQLALLLADVDETATQPQAAASLGGVATNRNLKGDIAVAHAEQLVVAFLKMEAQLGGDQLYLSIASHLEALHHIARDGYAPLLRALGQLSQMAGWLAIDSSRHDLARRHLSTTVLAAHQAEDSALAASALAYLSLQATYQDRPKQALTLAHTALTVADNTTPRVSTMLATRLARAQAKLGDRKACLEALETAEQSFDASCSSPEPIWISYVDPVEVAAQKGACYLELAMYPQALESLADALSLMDRLKPTHIRDRVHYLSRVAKCHLATSNVEEACAVGNQAIDAAVTMGSARVLDRLSEFDTALIPFASVQVARDFQERFTLFIQRR